MQTVISLVLLALLLYSPAGFAFSASEAAALYPAETTYSIYRKGKKIGTHRLSINTDNNRIDISIDSTITVRVLKIPVFRFRYQSKEQWLNNQLMSVISSTKTNDTIENTRLNNQAAQSILENETGESIESRIDLATNHWHIGAVEQTQLFNTIKGTRSAVTVTSLGTNNLTIHGKQIKATHYEYSGDIMAQSWYDQNQRWVKLVFAGTDGSEITYLIDNP